MLQEFDSSFTFEQAGLYKVKMLDPVTPALIFEAPNIEDCGPLQRFEMDLEIVTKEKLVLPARSSHSYSGRWF